MTEPRDIDDVVQIIYAFLSDNFDVAIGGGDDELRCDFRNVDVVIRVACPQREAEKRLALTEEE